jgi:hypothetical protein
MRGEGGEKAWTFSLIPRAITPVLALSTPAMHALVADHGALYLILF